MWLYGALLVVIAVTTVTLPHSRVRCAFGFAVIAALCVAALNSLPLGGSTTVTYSWDSPDLAEQIASWALGSLRRLYSEDGRSRSPTGAALRPWTRSGLPA